MILSIRKAILATTFTAIGILACDTSGSRDSSTEQAFTGVPSEDGGSSTTPDGGGGNANDAGTTTGDATAPAVTPVPSLPVCSDGQVAAIMHASDRGEVDMAKAIVDRLQNASVKAFAQQMITDHTALDDALTVVLKATGITLEENGLSKEISDSTMLETNALKAKSGAELDQAYIEHAVLDHVMDLGLADHILAPSIKNTQLAAAAAHARTVIAGHAQLATQVQTSVEGSCGANAGK